MLMTNDAGVTHPIPALGSSYDAPVLVLNPETGCYRVVYLGCQVGPEIDVVAERARLAAQSSGADGVKDT